MLRMHWLRKKCSLVISFVFIPISKEGQCQVFQVRRPILFLFPLQSRTGLSEGISVRLTVMVGGCVVLYVPSLCSWSDLIDAVLTGLHVVVLFLVPKILKKFANNKNNKVIYILFIEKNAALLYYACIILCKIQSMYFLRKCSNY